MAEIALVRTAATPTAVIAQATTWEALPALWPELLGEVWAFVRSAGLDAGRNVMVYLDDVPRVEVGVEVVSGPFDDRRFEDRGRVRASALPGGLAAHGVARGAPSPEGIGAAHAAVKTWCEANGHALDGTRWEVYDHWRDDRDPAEFETNVYWSVVSGT
jgi:effector-binding domain-containing protein